MGHLKGKGKAKTKKKQMRLNSKKNIKGTIDEVGRCLLIKYQVFFASLAQ
jgi:hypothetical protein